VDKEIDKDVITLTKPVRREDLIGAVTRAVSGEKEATIKLPDEILHAVRPISILLAEDNPTNQMVAKGLMRNLGYEIDVVDQKFYDLILMDVQMPVLDGLQTTQKLRMKVIAPKQPIIIAMTANASEEDKQVCLFSGMNDYLSKPVTRGEIIEKIENWFPEN
jgi:CheY-like chemotaxis protein